MRNPLNDTSYNFMKFVMTPPVMDRTEYEMYEPKTSTMRIVSNRSNGEGLGQLPSVIPTQGMFGGNDWVMPVVVIVVSAMALMFVYAIISDRKR